jgi:hypothetical protein
MEDCSHFYVAGSPRDVAQQQNERYRASETCGSDNTLPEQALVIMEICNILSKTHLLGQAHTYMAACVRVISPPRSPDNGANKATNAKSHDELILDSSLTCTRHFYELHRQHALCEPSRQHVALAKLCPDGRAMVGAIILVHSSSTWKHDLLNLLV